METNDKPHHPDCAALLEKCSAYLEKDLDACCCRELEEHLASCPECAQKMDGMKALLRACQQLQSDGIPKVRPDLKAQILSVLK